MNRRSFEWANFEWGLRPLHLLAPFIFWLPSFPGRSAPPAPLCITCFPSALLDPLCIAPRPQHCPHSRSLNDFNERRPHRAPGTAMPHATARRTRTRSLTPHADVHYADFRHAIAHPRPTGLRRVADRTPSARNHRRGSRPNRSPHPTITVPPSRPQRHGAGAARAAADQRRGRAFQEARPG